MFFSGVTWAGSQLPVADLNVDCRRLAPQNERPICVARYGPYEGIFAVDTGANRTFAWEPRELVEKPSKDWKILNEQFQFASGLGDTKLIRGIEVSVFGRPATSSEISYRPRDNQNTQIQQLKGFIGVRDLQEFPLRVYLNQAICEPYRGDVEEYDLSIPMHLDSTGQPLVQIEFPALASKSALLDTCCSGFIAIPDTMIDRFVRSGIAKEAGIIEASNVMGVHSVKCYILREVKVADYVFHNVEAVTYPFYKIGLGVRFFRHFDCVFDFPERQLRLTPDDDSWPKMVAPDASGLVFDFDENDELYIGRIHSRNVETAKVLRPKDVITKFDGRSPSEFTYLQIKDRLCEAGTSLPLRIRRGGQEFDVDLKLCYPFEYPPKWGDIIEITDEVNAFEKFLHDTREKRDERMKKNIPR